MSAVASSSAAPDSIKMSPARRNCFSSPSSLRPLHHAAVGACPSAVGKEAWMGCRGMGWWWWCGGPKLAARLLFGHAGLQAHVAMCCCSTVQGTEAAVHPTPPCASQSLFAWLALTCVQT
jgi:hypothetical protein